MLTGTVAIHAGGEYDTHRYQQHKMGAKGFAENGDIYRYAWAGATTGTDYIAGYLLVALTEESAHQNIALSAAVAVGATKLQPTLGATAVDANEYDEGTIGFNDVSPEGEWYTISHHEAAALSTVCDVYITPALKTAGTTSSEVSLVRNPWNRPAISQLIDERPCGVALQDWDLSAYEQYGWLKTHGMAAVLQDATGTTKGYKCTISDQTNGAVGLFSDVDAEPEVGWLMETGTATEFNLVYLTID